jgi:hypothetical protein
LTDKRPNPESKRSVSLLTDGIHTRLNPELQIKAYHLTDVHLNPVMGLNEKGHQRV